MNNIWMLKKKWICFFAMLLFTLPSFAQEEKETFVELATVDSRTLEASITAVGSLVASNSIILKPEIAGKINRIAFKEGEKVQKGQVLIELDQTTANANVLDAEATLKLAQQNFKRLSAVREGSTAQQIDIAEATMLQAEANLAVVKSAQEKMTLIAPFDGYIGFSDIAVGQYVQVGQNLVSLVDTESLKLEFSLPERLVLSLEKGDTVSFHIEGTKEAFFAKIYAINPEVDASTHAVSFRADVDNAKRILKPGLFARVNVTLNSDQQLVVPEQAVFAQDGKQYVYRVIDRKVVGTEVTLGRRVPGYVEILSGLSSGEQVVAAGQLKLREGQLVADVNENTSQSQ